LLHLRLAEQLVEIVEQSQRERLAETALEFE
jgi:hypothetical protein